MSLDIFNITTTRYYDTYRASMKLMQKKLAILSYGNCNQHFGILNIKTVSPPESGRGELKQLVFRDAIKTRGIDNDHIFFRTSFE